MKEGREDHCFVHGKIIASQPAFLFEKKIRILPLYFIILNMLLSFDCKSLKVIVDDGTTECLRDIYPL